MRCSTHRWPLLFAGLLGACGARTTELTIEVHGPPHPLPRCAKGPASLGPLALRGVAIPEAKVSLKDGQGHVTTASSDAKGRIALKVAPGSYTLTAFAAGWRIVPGDALQVPPAKGGHPHELTLYPCISAGSHRYAVGFKRRVTLAARNRCGKRWQQVRYSWRQIAGPDVSATLRGQTSATLSFTTHAVEQLRPLPPSARVLAFSHPQAGEYLFELSAKNSAGQRSRSLVVVTATSVAGGLTSVPPYARTVFCGDAKGPWSWRLSRVPKGWEVTLDDATTRTPSIVPRPRDAIVAPKNVEIENTKNGLRFSVVVGSWSTVRRDCGRSDCHRSLEGEWLKTPHAQTWKRLLDGTLKLERGPATDACADCHATGYDLGAKGGGYDDAAQRLRVSVPLRRQAGNHAALPKELKELSGVYCLACHGPGRLDPPIAEQPGLFGVGICARCHDRPPEQALVAQWRLSRHAASAPPALNGPGRRKACARCHTAQGVYYAQFSNARPHSAKTAFLNCCESIEPVTCQACHHPMRATARKQVYRFGAVNTTSGLQVESAGSGAQCLSCHRLDHAAGPALLRERSAPHSPQGDLFYGRAGFSFAAPAQAAKPAAAKPAATPPEPFRGKLACASKTKQGCATCHMHATPAPGQPAHDAIGGHTFAMRTKPKQGPSFELIAACKSCHPERTRFNAPAAADDDGDGRHEGQQDEIRGLLARLKALIEQRIAARAYAGCASGRPLAQSFARGAQHKIVLIDAAKKDLGDCDGNGAIERAERPFVFPATDLALHKAAYNYLLVHYDRSLGLHNYPFTVALLQQTLRGLAAQPGS